MIKLSHVISRLASHFISIYYSRRQDKSHYFYCNFKRNFTGNSERVGAAIAVYYKGALVVDLWGGLADRTTQNLWDRDTLAGIVCCTKGIAAICMAMKVDQGECSYSDKVVKFWPEFGHNNKQDITIEMILTHRAGLPYFDAEFNLNELTKDGIAKIIEAEFPKYPPGSKTEYHAVTFGWLIDQVFCRIDKKRRTVSEFFREEVQEKYNVEVYIGSSEEQETRVAKFPTVKKSVVLREYIHDRKIFAIGAHLSKKPTVTASRMRSSNEVGRFDDVRISQPQFCNEFDHALGEEENKGYGFIYTKSRTNSWQIGHPAIGGQCVYMDSKNDLVVCYLTNGLKSWVGDHPTCFGNLQLKIYEAVAEMAKRRSSEDIDEALNDQCI
ncbi:beta-lactamase [Ostertagia ostertagi]